MEVPDVGQCIADEVQRPALVRSLRQCDRRSGAATLAAAVPVDKHRFVTPTMLTNSAAYRADRRRDPVPNRKLIEDRDLWPAERERWVRLRGRSDDHRQPEHAPADDAEYGDQVGEPIRRAQFSVFGTAAGFEQNLADCELAPRPPLRNPVCASIPSGG